MKEISLNTISSFHSKLLSIQNHAYTPYSNFNVAALVVTTDNHEFSGVNVENPAYSACVCAERVALTQAYTQGYRQHDLKALYLITNSTKSGSPCGECRQVIAELMLQTALVYIINKSDKVKVYTVAELLPIPFISTDLNET